MNSELVIYDIIMVVVFPVTLFCSKPVQNEITVRIYPHEIRISLVLRYPETAIPYTNFRVRNSFEYFLRYVVGTGCMTMIEEKHGLRCTYRLD